MRLHCNFVCLSSPSFCKAVVLLNSPLQTFFAKVCHQQNTYIPRKMISQKCKPFADIGQARFHFLKFWCAAPNPPNGTALDVLLEA